VSRVIMFWSRRNWRRDYTSLGRVVTVIGSVSTIIVPVYGSRIFSVSGVAFITVVSIRGSVVFTDGVGTKAMVSSWFKRIIVSRGVSSVIG